MLNTMWYQQKHFWFDFKSRMLDSAPHRNHLRLPQRKKVAQTMHWFLERTKCDVMAIPKWKRPLDLLLLFTLSPIVVLLVCFLSALITLVSRGPVLFVQERVGFRGQRFRLFKFRTMHLNADSDIHANYLASLMDENVPMQKLDASGDKRLIPLGRYMRASGLDELPQLINVLRGEMSIVGPRPCTTYEYERYQPRHKQRFRALPGLTGLWQVNGKNRTTFEEMIEMDIRYADRATLWLDLKIVAKTPQTLLEQIWEPMRNSKGRERRSLTNAN
jgi:lipopolysaccharide/colanic/teichoic acid biosynthesis glycosyltransferase